MSEEEFEEELDDELEEVHEEPSLDQLSQAFAEAMGRNQTATQPESEQTEDGGSSSEEDEELSESADSESTKDTPEEPEPEIDPDESCPVSPKTIFEAILFVGHPNNLAIAGKSIAKLIRGVEENELPDLMQELNQGYIEHEMPYEVVTELLAELESQEESDNESETSASRNKQDLETDESNSDESNSDESNSDESSSDESNSDEAASDDADSSENKPPPKKKASKSKRKRKKQEGIVAYRLRIRDEFEYLRENFYGRVREAQLSQLAIDVLAVVAYNQPIAREDINRLLDTGLDTSRVINQLVRRDLLERQTNKDASKSRRREYVTTPRFLQLFNLESVDDLPKTDAPESLR